MKRTYLSFGLIIMICAFFFCDKAEKIFTTIEKSKLAPPLGLQSITQNEQVTLFWYTSNYEKDFGGYFILQAEGDYTYLSSDTSISSVFLKTDSVEFSISSDDVVSQTITGLTNGTTYSFTVVSYNKKDKSKISYPSNIIKDTPRPEIETITIKSASTSDVTGDDSKAGFDFDTFDVVTVPAILGDYNTTDGIVDIVNEAFDPSGVDNIRLWFSGMNGAGLQDLGYMSNLDESNMAPDEGYSTTGESIAVLLGHVYAVKTGNDHYGKLIVTKIDGPNEDYGVTFNAAFQTQTGNRNYKPVWTLNDRLGIHP